MVSSCRRATTTQARGRSCHFSWGMATTAASAMAGWAMSSFSRSTERDPLPAGLDHVLGPVDEADVAVGADHGHVPGLQPAVGGERVAASGGRCSSRPRTTDPWPGPRRAPCRPRAGRPPTSASAMRRLDTRAGHTPGGPQVGLLLLGEIGPIGADPGDRGDGAGLGHAPRLANLDAELGPVRLGQGLGHGRTPAEDGAQADRSRPCRSGRTPIHTVGTPPARVAL